METLINEYDDLARKELKYEEKIDVTFSLQVMAFYRLSRAAVFALLAIAQEIRAIRYIQRNRVN